MSYGNIFHFRFCLLALTAAALLATPAVARARERAESIMGGALEVNSSIIAASSADAAMPVGIAVRF